MKQAAIDELRAYVDQLQVLSYKLARFSAGDRKMGRERRTALRYLDEAIDRLISSIGEERSFGEEMLHCRAENKQDLRIAS